MWEQISYNNYILGFAALLLLISVPCLYSFSTARYVIYALAHKHKVLETNKSLKGLCKFLKMFYQVALHKFCFYRASIAWIQLEIDTGERLLLKPNQQTHFIGMATGAFSCRVPIFV